MISILAGKYGEASMVGYTQSPGGFASPAASQGADKKGVSLPHLCMKPVREMCLCTCIIYNSKPNRKAEYICCLKKLNCK